MFRLYLAWTPFLWLLAGAANAAEAEENTPRPTHRIVVYYLHTTWRCPGCNSVESLSKAAVLGGTGVNSKTHTKIDVESPFPEAVRSGRLVFRAVDCDRERNKSLCASLGETMKVPIVTEWEDDVLVAKTPLKDAWHYLRDNEAFVAYIQKGTRPFVEKVLPARPDAGKTTR